MERRKAIRIAATASLTLLAGAGGIALSSGILSAGADEGVGRVSSVQPDSSVITVFVDEPALPGTSAVSASGPSSTAGPRSSVTTPTAPGATTLTSIDDDRTSTSIHDDDDSTSTSIDDHGEDDDDSTSTSIDDHDGDDDDDDNSGHGGRDDDD